MPDLDFYVGEYTGEEIDDAIGKATGASNPNLLINWYMVGLGNEDGRFPINQRRNTTYNTANGYTIDYWYNTRGNTVSPTADGLKLTFDKSITYQQVGQSIEHYEGLLGKQLTLSVLYDATVECYARCVDSDGNYNRVTLSAGTNQLASVTFTAPTGVTSLSVQISSMNYTYSSGYVIIKAIKLEIGSKQTLARKVNNVWQVTEVPNYQQELSKCQRYLWVQHGDATAAILAIGAANDSTSATFPIYLPTTMKSGTPTLISVGGVPRVYGFADNTNKNASAISLSTIKGNVAILSTTHTGLTAGQVLRLILINGQNLGISVEG